MKTWPTEEQKKRQFLVAVLATVAATLDGFVLVISFNPGMVLCEIVLASCAVLQWCIYSDIQTRIDIKAILTGQKGKNNKLHNKPDAGEALPRA